MLAFYATYLVNKRKGGSYVTSQAQENPVTLPPRELTPAEAQFLAVMEQRAQRVRITMLQHMLEQIPVYLETNGGTARGTFSDVMWIPTPNGFLEWVQPPAFVAGITADNFSADWGGIANELVGVWNNVMSYTGINEAAGFDAVDNVTPVITLAVTILANAGQQAANWSAFQDALQTELQNTQNSPNLGGKVQQGADEAITSLFLSVLDDPYAESTFPTPPGGWAGSDPCGLGMCAGNFGG